MSKTRKLLERLDRIPRDMTWEELSSLLERLGFSRKEGAGSRVLFFCASDPQRVIWLHRPHGRNPATVLSVYIRDVRDRLNEWGYYDD